MGEAVRNPMAARSFFCQIGSECSHWTDLNTKMRMPFSGSGVRENTGALDSGGEHQLCHVDMRCMQAIVRCITFSTTC